MKFNLEQPQPSPEKNENIDEIRSSLEEMSQSYYDELVELRNGNMEVLNSLIEKQEKLFHWRNSLKNVEKLTAEQEKTLLQVEAFLYELSEELQNIEGEIK
jgi:hypothetical protein